MKHENGEGPCPRCAEKLKDGHEDIQYWFYVIKEAFPDVHTSCIFRGKDEQDKAAKEGKSFLKWPNSKHNILGQDGSPRAEAMDLFRLNEEGKAEFRAGYYVQIANFLEDAGAPLEWGGHFRKLVDLPHFQMKEKN